jgi:hypothetical protein
MLSTIYGKSEGQPLGLIPLIADLFDQVKVFSALPMRHQFPMNAKIPRFYGWDNAGVSRCFLAVQN